MTSRSRSDRPSPARRRSGGGLEPLILATANPDKVVELRDLLGHRYDIQPRPADLPDTVEDGETLEANARKKALAVVEHTGAGALADDTGLFVSRLDGRPGVRSARYAGPEASSDDNVTKLLHELEGTTGPVERAAEFRTVIAAVWPGGEEIVVDGVVAGWITPERRGRGGFGYDPVFVPIEGDGRTFAEMTIAAKNELSHRGRAIAALLAALDERS